MSEIATETSRRRLLVGSVGLVSIAAWMMLWRFGAAVHAPAHHHDAAAGSSFALLFVGSWTLMMIAMMLPTSLPLLAAYETIAGSRPDRAVLVTLVALGYLTIWAAVGLVSHGGGLLIRALVDSSASPHARGAAAASLLLVAGLYQFTPLKYRCLEKCRSPLSFVLGYWQGEHDHRNAFRLGLHHGIFCVGCCWALMLLMFLFGVGNVLWMLALGIVMAVEKNVSWGRRLSAPLGVVLTIAGLVTLARV